MWYAEDNLDILDNYFNIPNKDNYFYNEFNKLFYFFINYLIPK
jgi:hypothetical protein